MPIYEFSCSVCGKVFEKNIPMDQLASGVRCPDGHSKVRRVYSPPTVMYKGSGFYVTDHRNTSSNDISKS